MGASKRIWPNCGRKMKQQFIKKNGISKLATFS